MPDQRNGSSGDERDEDVYVEEVKLTEENAEQTLRKFLAAIARFTDALEAGRSFGNSQLMHQVIRDLAVLIENVLPRLRAEADRFELMGNQELFVTLKTLIDELEDRHLHILRTYLSHRAATDSSAAPLQ